MTRIERTEQIIREWKAKAKRYKEMNFNRNYQSCQDTILGLNLALDVFKGPSNHSNATDSNNSLCLCPEHFGDCEHCSNGECGSPLI
jgi:hypothetical protein